MKELVTRDSLKVLLTDPDAQFVDDVIGHALWALFLRQTASEQSSVSSQTSNGRGFSEADARSGSITAKYYKKHGHLGRCSCKVNGDRHKMGVDHKVDNTEFWRTARWTKEASNGYPKLCAYYVQLNQIANEKADAAVARGQAALIAPPELPPYDAEADALHSEAAHQGAYDVIDKVAGFLVDDLNNTKDLSVAWDEAAIAEIFDHLDTQRNSR